MARKPGPRGIEPRLTVVERGLRSLGTNDAAIVKAVREGFTRMENRLDQIYNYIDGFIKLHETLDIEFKSHERADETSQRADKPFGSSRQELTAPDFRS